MTKEQEIKLASTEGRGKMENKKEKKRAKMSKGAVCVNETKVDQIVEAYTNNGSMRTMQDGFVLFYLEAAKMDSKVQPDVRVTYKPTGERVPQGPW